MEFSHHLALLAGYLVAMLGWMALRSWLPDLWPARETRLFARPWLEFGFALVAAVLVLGIGQLYMRGNLLPEAGRGPGIANLLNQVLIFLPMPALLLIRRQPLATAWLPLTQVPLRIGLGLILALAALAGVSLARGTQADWPGMVRFVYQPAHAHFLLHVLLEDFTIAVVFVRLATALRRTGVVALVVASLFAAGHVPGALTDGAGLLDLAPLLLDIVLGTGVLVVVRRSADIWWFWCVHFALDMTQF